MIQLKADSITKRYGQKSVIDGLSFSHWATVLGVSGANGSGKTTLLKCLTGLLKPSSGSVTWQLDDKKLNKTELKSSLGYAAPYIQLYEELTVLENLQFLCELGNNLTTPDLDDHLRHFDASDFSGSYFGNLSTGQQQRAKLAAATVKNPSILVLDEPGSNLDLDGKQLVRKLVSDYASAGKMVIIASNQPDELDLCKEIIDLNH